MAVEMGIRGIEFVRQPIVEVRYKGQSVGGNRLDFIVGNCLPLELKAVDSLMPIHLAQLRSDLKATGYQLGLLINFSAPQLRAGGIKRVILS